MSLYGTGRGEGITAALLAGVLVLLARTFGAWLADEELLAALAPAALPALGAMLCYRFLRAQQRSRFAAFLVGAGYGLSPWLLAMSSSPREQLAAALAPLALEMVCRCDRPQQRAMWLPWAWLGLAAPFLAGLTVVGMVCAMLCAAVLVRAYLCGDRDEQQPLWPLVLLAALAIGNLLWLDPLAGWLPPTDPLSSERVLTYHRPLDRGFDAAAVLRVPGPVLLTFALLGLLRRQRHVDAHAWVPIAAAGGLPTLFAAIPWLTAAAPTWAQHPMLPASAWWLTLFAVAVLAAAGIDDFLELPLRRRTALPWLLALAVAGAPWLPLCGSRAPNREWPLTATFLALALILPSWRRLGILRFKNWLATTAIVALAIPLLQVRLPVLVGPPPPPSPAGEGAAPASAFAQLAQHPVWHYAGLLAALAAGCLLAWSAWRRNRHANRRPIPATAAIVKKAPPSQRR